MSPVTATQVAPDGALRRWCEEARFRDAYCAPLLSPALTATEIFLRVVQATPAWVAMLMSLRNRIVRPLGLKTVGPLNAAVDRAPGTYRVGDRIGQFTILSNSDDELVLGLDDRHLDVRIWVRRSVALPSGSYVVATAVKVHNWLGRMYMVPVGRIHPRVVKALMRRAQV
jgi:hypothetical protein